MPQPLVLETPELQTNDIFKTFDSQDALAKSYLELQGRVSAGGIDLLPEEIRKDSTISSFKTVAELAKGYVETKKLVGTIKKAPETADGYKLTALKDLHPNIKPEGIQKALTGIFHKAGLHNEAADMVQQEVLTVLSTGMAQADVARTELAKKNETALRAEWGGDYDKKMDSIINTLNRAGGVAQTEVDAVAKAMKGSPTLLKALGKIVGILSEDSIGKIGEAGDKQVTDKTEAQTKIQSLLKEISADPKHPYHDQKNPKHDEFMKEWTRLHELAFS